ncbi:MAG: hypothetical protein PEPC_01678 [Peptostreptococcus russellii]
MATNKRSSLTSLLKEANKVSAKVDDIKSVAGNTSVNPDSIIDPTESIKEDHVNSEDNSINAETPQTKMISEVEAKTSTENSRTEFDWFLNRRTIKDSESVRIPRELYKELKTLTNITGCTMNSLIGNILQDFLQSYDKDIQNRKKRFIKEIG